MKSTDIFQQTLHGGLLRKDQCSEVYFAHDNKVQGDVDAMLLACTALCQKHVPRRYGLRDCQLNRDKETCLVLALMLVPIPVIVSAALKNAFGLGARGWSSDSPCCWTVQRYIAQRENFVNACRLPTASVDRLKHDQYSRTSEILLNQERLPCQMPM